MMRWSKLACLLAAAGVAACDSRTAPAGPVPVDAGPRVVFKGVRVGDVGVVADGQSGKPWMARSKEDMDEILLYTGKDNARAAAVINERALFLAPGMRLRLNAPPEGKAGIQVTVLHGQHAGTRGWMWPNYFSAKPK